tara:strand:+ start:281 stop:517 length:237 start_codon:yes stop_codon:yes gene_type:complete
MAYNPGFFSSEEQDPLEQLLLNLSELGTILTNIVKNNDTAENVKMAYLVNNTVPHNISEILNNKDAVPEPSGSASPAA